MPGSLVHRRINVSFGMGQGNLGTAGVTNHQLIGKRISVKAIYSGEIRGTANVQIYGMTLSEMNALSRFGLQAEEQPHNTIRVEAGDDEGGMGSVFEGTVTYAWPDMTNQPQVVFRVEAHVGQFDAVKQTEATSFKGPTPFKTVAEAIAKKFSTPRQLDLGDVKAVLNSPYFYGSPWMQFAQLAKAARAAWHDDDEKTLAAWPMGKARGGGGSGGNVISKETGMVADPIGTPTGILVKQLFQRPYKFGTPITVQSILDQANGSWNIVRLEYSLESEMPHGEWFVIIEANKAGKEMADVPNTQQGYPGQQTPFSDRSQYQMMRFMVEQMLARVHTAMLVKVSKATSKGEVKEPGQVDVQPLVKTMDGKGNSFSHGTINELPYFRLQSGSKGIIMDPKEGDIGLAVFGQRDISGVKKTKKESAPGSYRRHDMADGMLFPSFLGGKPTSYVQFQDDGTIVVSPDDGKTTVTIKKDKVIAKTSGDYEFVITNSIAQIKKKGGMHVSVTDNDVLVGKAPVVAADPNPGD